MSQVKRFFSRVWDAIDSRFSRPQVKREHLLLYTSLVLIMVSAFLLRILPYFQTELLLKGLDPWVQYRCALYINENGLADFLNWYDQSSWYPYGRYMGSSMFILIPLSAVVFYKIALFLGINTTMLAVCYFTPAIFGTATVFVIYKLGSALHSKRSGVLSAFFITMVPGFMSRTIAGFFDNECIGIFLMFLTFYFFVQGLTKDSIVHSIFAGISLGGLSLTWGAYRFGYSLIALYAFVLILMRKFSRRLLTSFSITILIALLMGSLIPRNGVDFAFSTEQLIPLGVIVLMLVITVYQELQKHISAETLKRTVQIGTLTIIGVGIVTAIVLYALGTIEPIASKFLRTIFPTLAESLPLIESVAENLPAAWGNLFFSIHIMVFMIPLGLYYCIKKPNEKTLFILILGITGTYFGGSMVRLSLIFTPAAAIVSGYTVDEVLRPFALIFQERFTISRRKRRATKQIGRELIAVAYIFMAFALMFIAIFGINMTNEAYSQRHELTPQIQQQGGATFAANDYQETFEFLKQQIAPYKPGEKPPLVLSWWDYGYQITNLGNCTTMVDNATINSTQIGVVGAMLIYNETASYKLMKKYGVDYVLVLSPGVVGSTSNDIYKSQWMMKIAEKNYAASGIDDTDYYVGDKPIDEGGGFQDAFWDSVIYKLCAYKLNSNGQYGTSGQQISDFRDNDQSLASAPDVNTLEHFNLVFQSRYALLRIYQVVEVATAQP